MRRHFLFSACLFAILVGIGRTRANGADTRMLAQPAVSATHVAFVYAGDLWCARLDGSDVRRLTTSEGPVSNPAFSPDGRSLAFSAQYAGNTDVYLVGIDGGAPTRLTWHPGADLVQGFTPDGRNVVFTSPRAVYTARYTQLFTVPVSGGVETALSIPNAARASYSPDGHRIAYDPLAPPFLQWKHYRGGQVSTVVLFDVQSTATEKITQPASRANDVDPVWIGQTVFFRSDRDGEFNIYAYDSASKQVRQVTHHSDFPVLNISAGGGHVVYEQAGYLHLLDPASGQAKKLTFAVPSDLRETRERFVRGDKWIRAASLSPSGARAVFEFRGDIVTVPAEKGDVRNLTLSPAVHERTPVWSPDGTRIAYFSDKGGEYQLVIEQQDGKGEPRVLALEGHGFYDNPTWSPDSQKIAYTDNSQSIYWIDLKTGRAKKIASQETYTPSPQLRTAWSPDSKWLAYTIGTRPLVMAVSLYSTEQDKSFAVTDGLAEVTEPVFDRSGKYLYFFGSTDAGPILDWFSQSGNDMQETRNIYLTVLRKDLSSPLAKESDEEGTAKASDAKDSKEAKDAKDQPGSPDAPHGGGAPAGAAHPDAPFRIDLDDIQFRILDMPIPAGKLSGLQAGNPGQLYFIRDLDGKPTLQRFDLEKRKPETVLSEVAEYRLSADGKKMLYRSKDVWFIVATTKEVKAGEGKIATDSIELKIDPRAEWTEIFNEAWRTNRDYFYDPGMHGVDWAAARQKYAAFLPEITTRSDLNRVMQWMASELSVGHHRLTSPGDVPSAEHAVPGGLLGADYTVENGRYRFKKVYGGLNWTPQLRSPLTEPGVNVRAGEYLLAVNGRDLRATDQSVQRLREHRREDHRDHRRPECGRYRLANGAGGASGERADAADARLGGEQPARGGQSHQRPRRLRLRPQHGRPGARLLQALLLSASAQGRDHRRRALQRRRPGRRLLHRHPPPAAGQPLGDAIRRRSEDADRVDSGTEGDDHRRNRRLRRRPAAVDVPQVQSRPDRRQRGRGAASSASSGSRNSSTAAAITAPNLAIWTENGWVVENEGVPPDVEVEQTPADVIAGRDPQLEKAIALALDALKKSAPAEAKRPPYKKAIGG